MTSAEAYCEGWRSTMAGYDPRFHCPYPRKSNAAYAWVAGALDAFEAEDGETPDAEAAGFGKEDK